MHKYLHRTQSFEIYNIIKHLETRKSQTLSNDMVQITLQYGTFYTYF